MARRSTRKNAIPASLVEDAYLPGYDDFGFWGDAFSPAVEGFLDRKNAQTCAAATAGIARAGLTQARCLAISSGGDKGAFAAVLLTGWSECGSRPVFEIVTGVSPPIGTPVNLLHEQRRAVRDAMAPAIGVYAAACFERARRYNPFAHALRKSSPSRTALRRCHHRQIVLVIFVPPSREHQIRRRLRA